MRDEVDESAGDGALVDALATTRIAIIADRANLLSHAGQTTFVTAAMLMARSAHSVHLLAPNLPMIGPQPPLPQGHLVEELMRVGNDMLPGIAFAASAGTEEFDLAVALGDSPIPVRARRKIGINATSWRGCIVPEIARERWNATGWPLGGMAAATLASAEAFKIALRKLHAFARNPIRMNSVFADTNAVSFALAPDGSPCCAALERFDCVSGGAITNALLYALARVPAATGAARVIEPEVSDIGNLNRYMLLRRSRLGSSKAEDLADVLANTGLRIRPVPLRFDRMSRVSLRPLAANVLVGVDHIPTRWAVQREMPDWLTVGATTHWSVMASYHRPDTACTECLHPYDDPSDDPIPTVAFVSFWAGLLSAAYFLRHRSGEDAPLAEQHIFLTAPRTENPTRSVVGTRALCPICNASAIAQLDTAA